MYKRSITSNEIKVLAILCDKEEWNHIITERNSDKEYDINISGEKGGANKSMSGGWLPLNIIYLVWADDRIWRLTDAYGSKGYIPSQGYDWSGVRDSSTEAIWKMFDVAIKILEEDEIKKNIETVLEAEKHIDETKLIEKVAKCTGLIDLAIEKLEDTTVPQNKDEIIGLILGARNCTISQLRTFQISLGVEHKNLLSTFKKYGHE